MNEAGVRVVCDAGPLIHLDELGCITLLDDFEEVLVPALVWQEVAHHRPGVLTQIIVALTQVQVTIPAHSPFQALVKSLSLDLGEQAALALMQTHSEAILLTDDAAARLAAVTLGYQVHGTIGVLIRAIRRQQKPKEEVLSILHTLPTHSTLHIRPGLLKEIITQVEHQSWPNV